MPDTFTREELYDLVWQEPVTKLAKRFGLSDNGFAKACRKLNVPRPSRGYWARKTAGKATAKSPLPVRSPGMKETVTIGSGRDYRYVQIPNEELLRMDIVPPAYDEALGSVRRRIRKSIGKVRPDSAGEGVHPVIQKLLDADMERLKRSVKNRHDFGWEKPLFTDDVEKRRLKLLNSIALALSHMDMTIRTGTNDGRDLVAVINDTLVYFSLDTTSQNRKPEWRSAIETRGGSERLILHVFHGSYSSPSVKSWQDKGRGKLESRLTEIVEELVLSGERRHREAMQQRYKWLVERKQNLIEKLEREREEAERREKEKKAALEQARIDRLSEDARMFRQAADIREFVTQVQLRCDNDVISITNERLADWVNWALREADRIDPVKSLRFLDAVAELGRSE